MRARGSARRPHNVGFFDRAEGFVPSSGDGRGHREQVGPRFPRTSAGARLPAASLTRSARPVRIQQVDGSRNPHAVTAAPPHICRFTAGHFGQPSSEGKGEVAGHHLWGSALPVSWQSLESPACAGCHRALMFGCRGHRVVRRFRRCPASRVVHSDTEALLRCR